MLTQVLHIVQRVVRRTVAIQVIGGINDTTDVVLSHAHIGEGLRNWIGLVQFFAERQGERITEVCRPEPSIFQVLLAFNL